MKCLVLAGGNGNSLWPLSREKYPKQFMNIKENRSLFQETIARNLPFCEEFMIVTNRDYHFIVESQMQIFQGVKYCCFLEEERKGTAPSLIIASMCCNPSETIYVVSADLQIGSDSYKEAIIEAKGMTKYSAAVIFGIQPESADVNFGYMLLDNHKVTKFHEKPEQKIAEEYIEQKYQWNSGNMLLIVKNFLKEIRDLNPILFAACEKIVDELSRESRIVILPFNELEDFPIMSIEHIFLEKSEHIYAVEAMYKWCDIGNFETLLQWNQSLQHNMIVENCNNTEVINESDSKLVVVNNIEDALVVNTDDAILITSKAEANRRKRVIKNHLQQYNDFFENSNIRYRAWGTYENLTRGEGYKVKKVTLFSGKSFNRHKHNFRSEHWSIIRGVATVNIEMETKDYYPNSSIFVPAGQVHCIANNTSEDVIIIEVSIGSDIKEEDTVSLQKEKAIIQRRYDLLVKMTPSFKDYLWGGNRLKTEYHKKCDYDVVAESWEVSAHNAGQSTIAEGYNKGILFKEYLDIIGKEAWGWKCQTFDRFPLMVKFIDAKQDLSIQVHPGDEYALTVEKQYGKNEMWYVVECDNDAYLYCGLKEDISKERLKRALKSGTVIELLNKVPVKKGDTFFIEAGTIHAIGPGILICEIQQNSDVTYRIYDYDRKDEYGNFRKLHVKQALEVAKLTKWETEKYEKCILQKNEKFTVELLGECKYFRCIKCITEDIFEIQNDESSFRTITFLNGKGTISYGNNECFFESGDSFFLCAGDEKLYIKGESEFIIVTT